MNPSRLLPVVLLALSACVSSAPRMELPVRMEADCENRAVKQTAIESIVASTDDRLQPGTYPGDKVLRAVIKRGGGVFAYWNGQPLKLPETAKALGATGEYLILTRAVITNEIADGSRPIWLTLDTPSGRKIVLERAFDLQNVCIEGQRDL